MLLKNRNGWVLSRLEHQGISAYKHYFFCTCGHEFQVKTALNNPLPPDMLCPTCGEDYFKDAHEFLHKKDIRIWKSFYWDSEGRQDDKKWYMTLKYLIPIYNPLTKTVQLETQTLLQVEFPKYGNSFFHITNKAYFITSYNLFLDGKVEPLLGLLSDDASYKLYEYIMSHKTENIAWLKKDDIECLPVDKRLKCIEFFLKNPHLKEYQFFFWKMDLLHHKTTQYPLQIEMIDFIANHIKVKSVKRELYNSYDIFIKKFEVYEPYSDYIFSRTISNIDLLVKLYKMNPKTKLALFGGDYLDIYIDFIEFLKLHYSQKQITEFFITHLQEKKYTEQRQKEWKDTLRMIDSVSKTKEIRKYYLKPKLNTKNLHNEIVRISHIVRYEIQEKEEFQYQNAHIKAQGKFKNLKFSLPKTVNELYRWSKALRNCMFAYSDDIHLQNSIIFGVFKEKKLLYAVEIKNNQITQAKAHSNRTVHCEDMETIKKWHQWMLMSGEILK